MVRWMIHRATLGSLAALLLQQRLVSSRCWTCLTAIARVCPIPRFRVGRSRHIRAVRVRQGFGCGLVGQIPLGVQYGLQERMVISRRLCGSLRLCLSNDRRSLRSSAFVCSTERSSTYTKLPDFLISSLSKWKLTDGKGEVHERNAFLHIGEMLAKARFIVRELCLGPFVAALPTQDLLCLWAGARDGIQIILEAVYAIVDRRCGIV